MTILLSPADHLKAHIRDDLYLCLRPLLNSFICNPAESQVLGSQCNKSNPKSDQCEKGKTGLTNGHSYDHNLAWICLKLKVVKCSQEQQIITTERTLHTPLKVLVFISFIYYCMLGCIWLFALPRCENKNICQIVALFPNTIYWIIFHKSEPHYVSTSWSRFSILLQSFTSSLNRGL